MPNIFNEDAEGVLSDEELDEGIEQGDEPHGEEAVEVESETAAIVAAAEAPVVTLPAILYYDSHSHGKRRYYVSPGSFKPEWTYEISEAYVFDNKDHLQLAGMYCRKCQYVGLQIGQPSHFIPDLAYLTDKLDQLKSKVAELEKEKLQLLGG